MQGGTDGLKGLISAGAGNQRYWREVLGEYFINGQFAEPEAAFRELGTNAIDATRKDKSSSAVRVSVREGEARVRDRGTGMGIREIFGDFLIPSLTSKEAHGEASDRPTGRFGEGFYSSLKYLKKDGDRVIVRTSRGNETFYLFFSLRGGEIYFSMTAGGRTDRSCATEVTVRSASIDAKKAASFVRDSLSFSYHLPVLVNGERVNPFDKIAAFKAGDIRLFVSKDRAASKGRAVVTVNGDRVREFVITGSNVPRAIAIDLSPDTPLPVSRGEVELTPQIVRSLRELMSALPEGPDVGMMLNGLWPLIKYLEQKNPSFAVADDLALAFKQRAGILTGKKNLFLPDPGGIKDEGLRPRLLDPEIYDPAIAGAESAEPYTRISVNGLRVVIGDLGGGNKRVARAGDMIVIDRRHIPKGPIEERFLAAWVRANGLTVNLPYAGEKTPGADATSREMKELLARSKDRSHPVAQIRRVFDSPVLSPFLDELLVPFLEKTRQPKPKVANSIAYFLDEIPDGDEIPDWQREFAVEIARMAASLYTPAEETAKAIPRYLSTFCPVGGPDGPNWGIFFDEFHPNFTDLLARDPEFAKRLSERTRVLAVENTPDRRSYLQSVVFAKEHRPLSESLCWLNLLRFSSTLREMTKDEAAAKKGMALIRGAIERWEAGGRKLDDLREEIAILRIKLRFLGSPEGRRSADRPEEWARWEALLVRANPFGVAGEMDISIVDGYHALDDHFEAALRLFGGLRQGVFRDFLKFAGALTRYYYKKIPPDEVIDRCLKIWSQRVLKMSHRDYEALREDIYLLFFPLGGGRPYIGPSVEAILNYVTGTIPFLADVSMAPPWAFPDDGEGFLLSGLVEGRLTNERTSGGQTLAGKYAARIVRQAINDEISDPDVFLREIIEHNLLQAGLRSSSGAGALAVRVSESPDGELVTSFEGPFGMTRGMVEEALLIPGINGETNRRFLTVFKGAKRVTIRTLKEGADSVEMEFVPVRAPDGRVLDVEYRERIGAANEMRAGTLIEVVRETNSAEVDAAMICSRLQRYGECVHPERLRVTFNGQEINRSLTPLKSEGSAGDDLRFFTGAGRPLLTRDGLFVRALDADYLASLPPTLKKIAESEGVVVDLPRSVTLIRDGSDIAEKSRMAPRIQMALARAIVRHAFEKFLKGDLPLNDLPYDLFERAPGYEVADQIAWDAGHLIEGRDIPLEKYLKDALLQQLMIALPVIRVEGETEWLSLLRVIQRYKESSVGIDKLPPTVREYIEREEKKIGSKDEAGKKEFEKKGLVETPAFRLPRNPVPKADSYWAFLEIAGAIGNRLNRDMPSSARAFSEGVYVSSPDSFMARVSPSTGVVEWNLNGADQMIESLALYLASTIDAARLTKLWLDIIYYTTHEQTHIVEGSPETGMTHDRKFHDINQVLIDALQKDAKWLERLLLKLRERYQGGHIPPAEFLRLMADAGR